LVEFVPVDCPEPLDWPEPAVGAPPALLVVFPEFAWPPLGVWPGCIGTVVPDDVIQADVVGPTGCACEGGIVPGCGVGAEGVVAGFVSGVCVGVVLCMSPAAFVVIGGGGPIVVGVVCVVGGGVVGAAGTAVGAVCVVGAALGVTGRGAGAAGGAAGTRL